MLNLDRIKGELLTQLRNDSQFSFVNTRLILKTGISLREIKPEEDRDPVVIEKVLGCLTEQGFTFKRG